MSYSFGGRTFSFKIEDKLRVKFYKENIWPTFEKYHLSQTLVSVCLFLSSNINLSCARRTHGRVAIWPPTDYLAKQPDMYTTASTA